MENLDLQEIRGQLDGIDSQLVELFERRMKLCGDVAEYKIGTGKAVYDAAREKEKLGTVTGMAHGDFNRQGVYELFSQIMTISRRLQYGILAGHGQCLDTGFTMVQELKRDHSRIVYQGVEGAYSHAAALQYFGDDADVYHVPSFEDAMVEVEEGRADYAVLPIENSSAGAVSGNYDNLVMHNLYIVAETQVSVNHALLGLKGAVLSDIKKRGTIPLITKTADAGDLLEGTAWEMFQKDLFCSHLYQAVVSGKYHTRLKNEYTHSVVMKS